MKQPKSLYSHSQQTTQLSAQMVLDNLLDNLPSHIYWKDSRGVYLGCNDRQAHCLGFKSGKEVLGKTDFELPWDEQVAKRFWENDQEVLLSGQAKTIEEWATVDGQPAIMLSLKAPLKDADSKTMGILGISIDITRQKHTEQRLLEAKEAAEIANHAKTAFLENISHDIRTPLAGIIGCAQAILDQSDDASNLPTIKENAHYLMTSGQALTQLLNQVLESVSVASGTLPLLKKQFQLQEILNHLVELNQARAGQKQLTLQLIYDHAIPRYMIGDPMRLQRIVSELLTNALNFTDTGQIKIMTQLAMRHKRDVVIKIAVEDTGIGIPEGQQQEVFTRFKRMTPSYQGIYMGAGLGLSIIKEFMDDLDGELHFESRPQKGSIFTCVLPFKIALLEERSPRIEATTLSSANSVLPIANPPTADVNVLAGKRILLIEDTAIAAHAAKFLLTQLGCVVDVAEDGKTALHYATTHEYQLILLDIGLPDISGIDWAKQFRQWEATQRQYTPVVALTAHATNQNEKDCLQAGIDAVLAKPLSKEQAMQVLKQFCAGTRKSENQ